MSEETIEERYERYMGKPDCGPAENDSWEALDLIKDLMAERKKLKEELDILREWRKEWSNLVQSWKKED